LEEAKVVPYFSQVVAGFAPRRPGFNPRFGRVFFMVGKVEMGQVFFQYFGFAC
jgi:hypothetical protein